MRLKDAADVSMEIQVLGILVVMSASWTLDVGKQTKVVVLGTIRLMHVKAWQFVVKGYIVSTVSQMSIARLWTLVCTQQK